MTVHVVVVGNVAVGIAAVVVFLFVIVVAAGTAFFLVRFASHGRSERSPFGIARSQSFRRLRVGLYVLAHWRWLPSISHSSHCVLWWSDVS